MSRSQTFFRNLLSLLEVSVLIFQKLLVSLVRNAWGNSGESGLRNKKTNSIFIPQFENFANSERLTIERKALTKRVIMDQEFADFISMYQSVEPQPDLPMFSRLEPEPDLPMF